MPPPVLCQSLVVPLLPPSLAPHLVGRKAAGRGEVRAVVTPF
jgi:hypothetical protein